MVELGLLPDPWQQAVLRSTSRRIALLASRQIGKSTCVALLGLSTAYFNPGSLVLLTAPTARQSELIFEKVASFHSRLLMVPAVKQLTDMLELENKSKIIALPGQDPANIRGFSNPALIVIDEASHISTGLRAVILPMLMGGGRLVMLGTPEGKVGWFYETFKISKDPTWERIDAKPIDSPRTDQAILAEMKATLDEREFKTMYENEFVEAYDAVFSESAIEKLLERDDPSVALPALDLERIWRGLLAKL